MPDVNVYACSAASRYVHQVAEALELEEHMPGAVTVGGTTIYLVAPADRLKRHERAHKHQAAELAPRWLRWAPLEVRAWAGAPKFWREYWRLFQIHGYVNHPFERDAREAEEPTEPGVKPPAGQGPAFT